MDYIMDCILAARVAHLCLRVLHVGAGHLQAVEVRLFCRESGLGRRRRSDYSTTQPWPGIEPTTGSKRPRDGPMVT
jgi:hypothetical protein